MTVDTNTDHTAEVNGERFYFGSAGRKDSFLTYPDQHAGDDQADDAWHHHAGTRRMRGAP